MPAGAGVTIPGTGEHRTMAAYIIRRILLMIPTLLGIMLVSFAVVQFAPFRDEKIEPLERISSAQHRT